VIDNQKIIFLDSGIGGISVLQDALKIMPNEDYLYFGDNLHAPYGTKTRDEVLQLTLDIVAKLNQTYAVKAMVIACNTMTSVAAEELRKIYQFPVIGMEPAIKPALEKLVNTNKRVLVLATPLTLTLEKFLSLMAKLDITHKIDTLPAPELVGFAENFDFSETTFLPYFAKKFHDLDFNKYGALVLGCTHFLFFKMLFAKVLPKHVVLIDGNVATVKHLQRRLHGKLKETGPGSVEYRFSGKQQPVELLSKNY
jgi:glutamate racemase